MRGDVAAWVGEVPITVQALREEVVRRGGRQSVESVLEELVRFQVLLAKARAAGYEQDPGLRAAWEQALVAKFQESQLAPREAAAREVSEDLVRARYEQEPARFTSPSRVRAGVVFLKCPEKADPEAKERLTVRAEEVRAEAVGADDARFAELARQFSEDQATRYRGGDAGWLVVGATNAPWEPAVMEALGVLGRPGDVGPVVATPKGFYILRCGAREASALVPLAQVRDGIRGQLARERVQEQREATFRELKAGLRIEINQAAVRSVVLPEAAGEPVPPRIPGG